MIEIPGRDPLKNENWEKFAKSVSVGLDGAAAYGQIYGNLANARTAAYRLLNDVRIMRRIDFLSKAKAAVKNGEVDVDFRVVVMTCQDIMLSANKVSDKLSAISTLNKLGVLEDKTKEKSPVDPATLCEYLAQFAGHPARELTKIPGGLEGLFKRLMDLTGTGTKEWQVLLSEMPEVAAKESDEKEVKAEVVPADGSEYGKDDTQSHGINDGDICRRKALEDFGPGIESIGNEEKENENEAGSDKGAGEVYDF